MKTQIVYTLISTENDIYLEQALVSIYSCKLHNPNAVIILITDKQTENTLIGKRTVINNYINHKIVISCPNNYTNKEKSRYLKTTIRQHINGDFLFLDCDTVVCSSLADVDNINAEIAMVPDTHVKYKDYPFYDYMNSLLMKLYKTDVSQDEYYFNSGAMFVRDTPLTHKLFNLWNKHWEESRLKGIPTDQQALFKVNHDLGNIIHQLPGIYNCQIGLSIQYFYEAKVIHYFNAQMLSKTDMSPFFMKEFYEQIKKDGKITIQSKRLIENCKTEFISPSMIISRTEMNFLLSPVGNCILTEFTKNGIFYKIIRFLLLAKRKIQSKFHIFNFYV